MATFRRVFPRDRCSRGGGRSAGDTTARLTQFIQRQVRRDEMHRTARPRPIADGSSTQRRYHELAVPQVDQLRDRHLVDSAKRFVAFLVPSASRGLV